ncbi:MAG: DUF192 domain-containing protein [Firmicutes bacterium]|nr:DUF192 domain-containing protein [Bacillota bacterium]
MPKVVNRSRGTLVAAGLVRAAGFRARLRGLIGSRPREGLALLIAPCRAVHTWFMNRPIDVLFLDGDGRVVRLVEGMRPFRFGPFVPRARAVIEVEAGQAAASGTRPGDVLEIVGDGE